MKKQRPDKSWGKWSVWRLSGRDSLAPQVGVGWGLKQPHTLGWLTLAMNKECVT